MEWDATCDEEGGAGRKGHKSQRQTSSTRCRDYGRPPPRPAQAQAQATGMGEATVIEEGNQSAFNPRSL